MADTEGMDRTNQHILWQYFVMGIVTGIWLAGLILLILERMGSIAVGGG